MTIIPTPGADLDRLRGALIDLGLWPVLVSGLDGRSAFEIAHERPVASSLHAIAALPGVDQVLAESSPHPLLDDQATTVELGRGVVIGAGQAPVLIAGPCGVESENQIHAAAESLAAHGVRALRGGAFKPRTSPYSFAGHGSRALRWLREAADQHDLVVVTEALSERHVDLVARHADMIQVGSRNMSDFALLREVGGAGLPVLLKRGMCATLDEWLLAGEHCLHAGAPNVVFCERGVRGFDERFRNILDLGTVAMISQTLGQPVVVDPSHGTGRRELVIPLTRAALALGVAGVMVEFHNEPRAARSDGPQALLPRQLAALARVFLERRELPITRSQASRGATLGDA